MDRDIWSTHLDLAPWADDFSRAFDLFWQTYVDPDTGVLYDAPIDECMQRADVTDAPFMHRNDAEKLTPITMRPDLGAWPTPDEVATSMPTINGWDTAIENATAEGGILLAALSRGALNLGEPQRRRCIDHVYKGLISLWAVPGRTGFVCRGYLPKTQAFYKQTSLDQLPCYIFGLWQFFDSTYCDDQQKREIAQCVHSIMSWLENAGWRLTLHNDSRRTPHSACFSTDPGQLTKSLAMLLMAWQVTGDDHWQDVYHQWRDADDGAYLRAIERRDKTWQVYQIMYTSIMLDILATYDQEPRYRAFYHEQRRLLMHPLALFCSRHVYAQYQPSSAEASATIHAQRDTLIDFRSALARAVQDEPFNPNNARFMWVYRHHLERDRLVQGALGDGWLTFDYFAATGAHQAIMRDWPDNRPSWGAEHTRATLEGFYARLCFDHPLRFFPKLALATVLD